MSLVFNKKAGYDYTVVKTYQAGVILTGAEVKSLKRQAGSLTGSFVKVLGDEVFLINAQISPYPFSDPRDYDPKRTRKLLLKKAEIAQLKEASAQKGLTLVPISLELEGKFIKLTIGIGRGKKQYEHRAELKKRTQQREIQRFMKKRI